MRRAAVFAPILAALAVAVAMASAPIVYRVEGNALAAPPTVPASATQLDCVSTDPADVGPILIRGLAQNWTWQEELVTLDGVTPVSTTLSYRASNRVYWHGPAPGPVGTVTVDHGANTLSTVEAGSPSSFDAVFTIGPGRADCKMLTVTEGATVWYRQGVSPHSARKLTPGEAAAGIGTYYALGSLGFAQFELVK